MSYKWQYRKIEKKFAKTSLFSNLSFVLGAGDLFFITGASGSGKSTLLFIIALLYKSDAGHIYFDKRILLENKKEVTLYRKRHIAFLSSSSLMLPCLTVIENLQLAAAFTGNKESLTSLLKETELLPLQNKYSHQLSQGQRQQISLLMSLAKQPSLLLLDEPTSALDYNAAERFMKLLTLRREKQATIITTHNRSLIQNGNLHLEMSENVINGDSFNKSLSSISTNSKLFPNLIKIALKNLFKEWLLIVLLTLSLAISFPLFFVSVNIQSAVDHLYKTPQESIFKLTEVNAKIKTVLDDNNINYRRSYDRFIAPFFPDDVYFHALEDSRFEQYNQVLVSPHFLKDSKQNVNEIVTLSQNARLIEEEIISLSGLKIIGMRDINGLSLTNIIYYSYDLFSQYINEHLKTDNLSLEIATYESARMAELLDRLEIKYQCIFLSVAKESRELASSLNYLIIITVAISLMGIFIILFLVLLILKRKRDEDLFRLFCLGGNNADLRNLLVMETAFQLGISLLISLIIFIPSGVVINYLLSSFFPSRHLISFDLFLTSGYLLLYWLVGVILVIVFVYKMKLDIKERLV